MGKDLRSLPAAVFRPRRRWREAFPFMAFLPCQLDAFNRPMTVTLIWRLPLVKPSPLHPCLSGVRPDFLVKARVVGASRCGQERQLSRGEGIVSVRHGNHVVQRREASVFGKPVVSQSCWCGPCLGLCDYLENTYCAAGTFAAKLYVVVTAWCRYRKCLRTQEKRDGPSPEPPASRRASQAPALPNRVCNRHAPDTRTRCAQ